jgi:dTMP kinase
LFGTFSLYSSIFWGRGSGTDPRATDRKRRHEVREMFITFEGVEGCGKTTQIRRLAKKLISHHVPVVLTFEPGGTRIGGKIRSLLLDSKNRNLSSFSELMLYAADRAQHMEEVIKPALDQGKWVLCDRFTDATTAYQGIARGLDMKLILELNATVTQGIKPDMTLLLDCPIELGLARALQRNRTGKTKGEDRFEREKKAFHRMVREGYLMLSRKEPKRIIVIPSDASKTEVEESIFSHIEPFVNRYLSARPSTRRKKR